MPFKPLSDRVKKHKASKANETRLHEAAEAYLAAKNGPGKLSFRKIEERFPGVKKSTLERYINGKGKTKLEFSATKQKLSQIEENVLVNFILESANRGFPLKHREIRQYANAIRQSRLGTDCEPVSDFWIYRFLDRHHEQLATHWSKPLDMQRARSLNPEAVKSWFDLVEKFIVDLGIDPENIYGMDESGFPTAYAGKERVVGGRGTKTQHKQGGADRENITAVVTICADGTSVRPLLIFKGKNIKESWTEGNTVNAFITTSDRGWTDGNIGRNWLEQIFDPETKEKAGGKPRVLLLDGHSSHYTLAFIDYARANNIILLGYPAHCTHALQGLDVVCFAKMKEAWKQEIVTFEDEKMRKVSKSEFTFLWSRAYQSAFTPDTISAAFRATGVHPFSRETITEAQMKPSVTTSIKGCFPLPQPSPVRAVMASFNVNPPTAFAVSPSTHTQHHPAESDDDENLVMLTPSRRKRGLEIDPSLYTPSKRMRILYTALSSTSSGSFLVSKTPLTSSTPIAAPVLEAVPSLPHPDWSLAYGDPAATHKTRQTLQKENELLKTHLKRAHTLSRAQDGIIEGSSATMVVQNMHLRKMNGALYGKETEKASTRTLVIDSSKGQVYSDDASRDGLFEQEERKKALAAVKRSKADGRAAKKEALAKLEEEWKRMKIIHEEATRMWKADCDRLASEGVPKKNWPKGPIRPRKPKLPATLGAVIDEDDGDDEEEDEQ